MSFLWHYYEKPYIAVVMSLLSSYQLQMKQWLFNTEAYFYS